MSSPERFPGQRRSFRCSVPPDQREAVLYAGRQRLPVRLLNESVEGAAVSVADRPGIRPNDVVRLSTTFGDFEARVIYLKEGQTAEAPRGGAKPGAQVGLEWLRQLDPLDGPCPSS